MFAPSTSRLKAEPAPDVPLADKVRFLCQPECLALPACTVEAHETHMSWLFLTEQHVYKLKKPVRSAYLDFSTIDQRAAACRTELALNRRLAPDVYLEVLPLRRTPDGLSFGAVGTIVDWLVLMRRLDERHTLETRAREQRLTRADAERLAARLATFYRRVRRLPVAPAVHLARWRRALLENEQLLRDPRFHLPEGAIARICRAQRAFLARRPDIIGRRARRIVEAHGDLRPEHIWLSDPVVVIDCLEFSAQLRALDPLDEIAFLHLECERLGVRWAGEALRRRLARPLGDRSGSGLFLFYRSHRALLRARLAIAHLLDADPRTPEKWPRLARTYIDLALADAGRLERILNRRTGRRVPDPCAAARSPRR
ncbi:MULTISPECIES: hypothetical protein [unclassified Chelatococcus]|uniref:hypothetical protein n=1 Tax=unclassified Chelatococcus TaxID=2638111 RepID=UPI000374478E|nr:MULTISPECIES: hypothetical protein [unclassified Chelatococcus]ALA18903.1 hypothetical protein AL346_17680 [Chelatococcus sp. CO-6]